LIFAGIAAAVLMTGIPGAAVQVDEKCGDGPAVETVASVRAHRLTAPVRLDGVLDEPDWQKPSAAPLIQNEPDNGCPPRLRTDWWIGYDDEALYVASRMFDSAPDSIHTQLGRRDDFPPSDFFVLTLDTFNDDRNGYGFAVNAGGAIFDEVLYNDGWDDPSWDGVWDYGVRIDELGWVLEMRIPFSQLNFPDQDVQVWGINVSRRTHRHRSRDELFHRPRGESGYISRCPDLVGIEGIEPGNRLEALAYGVGRMEFLEFLDGDPFQGGGDYEGDVGMDLQWGLSSNLTLNATINPDFGQVEVDPAVVNLSDFETFFEERRPFFVEDANIFRFGREGTNNNWSFNWMDPMPFYSRRVGRAPQLGQGYHLGYPDYYSVPAATTILGAGKVSGKIGNWSVGFLDAVTAEEKARLEQDGLRSNQIVEPMTNYSALRLKYARPDGNQGLGFMGTHTLRDLDFSLCAEHLARSATSAGVDGWLTLDEDEVWALKGYFSASHVTGEPAAIEALQRSSRRYYQRPDADHLELDSAATSLTGWASRVMLNKESGNWRLNTALGAISPGYEINDLGFSSRTDRINYHCAVGYRWLEPNRTFRNRYLDFATYHTWDFGGKRDNFGYGVFYWLQFTNYWGLGGSVFYNPERTNLWATRGGPAMRRPYFYEVNFNGDTDWRKALSASAHGSFWENGEGSHGFYTSLFLNLRPASTLRFSLGPEYAESHIKTEWYWNQEDPTGQYGYRYLFSDLAYREFSLTSRFDFTFSPRLSLQTYLQPLFAAGDYDGLKEFTDYGGFGFNVLGEDNGSTISYADGGYLIDPDGAGPAEEFFLFDRDFNFKSLKVNLVLRWEYLPGSTFFFVWTQDRVNLDDPGDFSLGRDLDSLLQAPGEDILLVKMTHWLDL